MHLSTRLPLKHANSPVQVPPWWEGTQTEENAGQENYPMDYYAKDGGVWNSSYHKASARQKMTENVAA